MSRRLHLLAITCCIVLFLAVVHLPAESTLSRKEVDVAIVLAVDVSGSVTEDSWVLQREGYAAAFRDPDVVRAITKGECGAIAVTMMQWASSLQQRQVVPWSYVNGLDGAASFAQALRDTKRIFNGMTSVSGAIGSGVALLETSPYSALRRVIDISGDGKNNDGESPKGIRALALAKGITINGLPIIGPEPDVEPYYRNVVIGGPGSFVVVAENVHDFGRAIRLKLILEIADARKQKKTPPS